MQHDDVLDGESPMLRGLSELRFFLSGVLRESESRGGGGRGRQQPPKKRAKRALRRSPSRPETSSAVP